MKVPTVRHVLSNSNPTLSFTVTSDGSARILPSLSSPRIISDPLHRITRFLCLPQQSFYVGLRSPPRVRLPLLKNHTTSVLVGYSLVLLDTGSNLQFACTFWE
ncbi:hypothetical protein BHE74_00054617 [Ensete ventricosum]|nr:hypothetical protein BHE74_00054617 [Ensete ventricosum]